MSWRKRRSGGRIVLGSPESDQFRTIPIPRFLADELAKRRTGMSFQRTRLSADRTLMAVIRTSLSLIGFGFSIYQIFKKLQESGPNPFIDHAGYVAYIDLKEKQFYAEFERQKNGGKPRP